MECKEKTMMKNLFLTLSFILLAASFIQGSWATYQNHTDSNSSSLECIIKRLEQEIAALNDSLISQVSQLQQANSALNASLTSQVSQLQQANSALSTALTAQIKQANSDLSASLTSKISQVQQQVSNIPNTIAQQVEALDIPKTESGYIYRCEGDSGYGLIGSDGERKTDCSPVTFQTPFSSVPAITTAIAQLSDDSDYVSLDVYPIDITESGFTICGATLDVITDYNAVWVAIGSP